MEKIVELRSDTYTKPTPQMLEAMAKAEVGNDGVGEDPTVNLLQEKAAKIMGKEAALFMCSGTMANLCAILAHCRRGESIILDSKSHIFMDETGGLATIAGCLAQALDCDNGIYDSQQLRNAISAGSLTHPRTGLVCLENTANRRGGLVLPIESVKKTTDIAHEYDIPVHLDGARIFNAAIALDVDVKEIANKVDSLQFCLSKGLGCPIGSILVGSSQFIGKAKLFRRMVGGGMRQVGVIAAAGLVALSDMIDRLADDHRRAKQLAVELAEIPAITVDLNKTETNMVFVNVNEKYIIDDIVAKLRSSGIYVASPASGQIRMVIHYEISDEDIEKTVLAFKKIM